MNNSKKVLLCLFLVIFIFVLVNLNLSQEKEQTASSTTQEKQIENESPKQKEGEEVLLIRFKLLGVLAVLGVAGLLVVLAYWKDLKIYFLTKKANRAAYEADVAFHLAIKEARASGKLADVEKIIGREISDEEIEDAEEKMSKKFKKGDTK